MKKLVLAFILLFACSVSTASAIQIQGQDFEVLDVTTSSLMVAPDYSTLGYYIWAEDDSRKDWNIVWRSDSDKHKFTGDIFLSANAFDLPVSLLSWNGNDSIETSSSQYVEYRAFARNGYDGISFSIIGDEMPSYLAFDLNVFNVTDNVYVNAVPYITIGDGSFSPVSSDFAMAAPVPEPATLLLLGSGLVGLAFMKRRKK